jgi:hypothetical protein
MTDSEQEEVQKMIDKSIDKAMAKHNRTATLISSVLGITVLAFYTHGLVTVVSQMRSGM